MKLLKRILFGLLGVIALLLVIALFVKKDYNVEQEVVVNKPNGDVFSYVKLARNHDNFNKWIMQDPQIKKSYQGSDGTEGFVYAWNSDGKAGQGEQKTTGIKEGERVDFAIHFIRPIESKATMYIATAAASPNQTTVKWHIDGHSPYPLNLMNLLIPGMLGNDMQQSLGTLKTVLEKQ